MAELKTLKDYTEKIVQLESQYKKVEEQLRKFENFDVVENLGNILIEKRFPASLQEEIVQWQQKYKDSRRESRLALLEKCLQAMKKLPDDEKIIIGSRLKNLSIYNGCGGFGSFKRPTTCGGCHEGERVITFLELEKWLTFCGDRQYEISSEDFKKAQVEVLKKIQKKYPALLEQNEQKEDLQKQLEKIENQIRCLKEQKKIMEQLNLLDLTPVLSILPEFWAVVQEIDNEIVKIAYDLEHRVVVFLVSRWFYYGSGGSEYGHDVIVFRDGQRAKTYYKWRDAYDQHADRPAYNFNDVRISKITKDRVEVVLINSHYNFSLKHTFSVAEREDNSTSISLEEKEEFKRHVEAEIQKILKAETRNATMPSYILAGYPLNIPTYTNSDIPYVQAQVIDKAIDYRKKVAVVVVKSQIDYCAGEGRQWGWYVYKITPQKTERVDSKNAYDVELKRGKKIVLKAQDYA
ncbi:MAG: hypothetical protein ACP5IX_00480 [Patescibacteria group bacterium]